MGGLTGNFRFPEDLNWESPTRWACGQLRAYNLGRTGLNRVLDGSSRRVMLRESSERLCIISRSLTRWMTIRSQSLKQSASVASILVSCELAVADPGLSRCGVSGRITRKVSLNGAAKSKCARCSGNLKFSIACNTAFRVRADDDWRRTSRVSRFTEN